MTIGFLLIVLMGSNDWRTREFATTCFDKACYYELLPYDIEKAAFEHKDLEIQHRARKVLENYYVVNEGAIDITYREFAIHNSPQSAEFATFQKNKELEGWHLYCYWAQNGTTTKCRFARVEVLRKK